VDEHLKERICSARAGAFTSKILVAVLVTSAVLVTWARHGVKPK